MLRAFRTAYSGVLKDVMDYSTAFFEGRMRPDDIYALNDPFEGGMHLPNVFILKPIFHRGERIAFAATVCHQTDMGGRVADSNASDSAKITMQLKRGDIDRHELPGGGGWGDPLEREPARVLRDVRNELVSLDSARKDYGVVIDTERMGVEGASVHQPVMAARKRAPNSSHFHSPTPLTPRNSSRVPGRRRTISRSVASLKTT